jgi:excisionase family DNA binding protein
MIPDHLLKVDAAAELIGVSRPTVYRLAREYPKELRNFKHGRYRVFERAAVMRFVEARKHLTQL